MIVRAALLLLALLVVLAALGRWRRIEPSRSAMMRSELERIAAASGLSRDTLEQVTKSLG